MHRDPPAGSRHGSARGGRQGAIRILIDHDNAGLPGGFGVHLAAYVVLALAGLLLAGQAKGRTDA